MTNVQKGNLHKLITPPAPKKKMLADGVIEGRGRGPTNTVAAGNFECDTYSDKYDIRISLYIINTLWVTQYNVFCLVVATYCKILYNRVG
jgi:hypothetical protein